MKPGVLFVAALLAISVSSGAVMADAAKGEKQFNRCKACHSIKAGKNRVGPSLHGVFGRTAGTVPKYRYSSSMKKAGEMGLKWGRANLMEYLKDPRAFLKKYLNKKRVSNKMMNKFKNEKLRNNIVSYLETLKD